MKSRPNVWRIYDYGDKMKKIFSILMILAAFGMLICAVSAVELQEHDFGDFKLDVPDESWIGDQVPFGKGYSGGGISIHHFTDNDLPGTIDDYIDSNQYDDVGTDGNLTIYKNGNKYVVLTHSDNEYYLISDRDLEEAKAIAKSAEFGANDLDSSDDASENVNNATPFEEDTVVTIEDINFTIPKGYTQLPTGSANSDHIFTSNDSQIIISIKNIGHEASVDDIAKADGDEDKQINGIDGVLSNQSGQCGFTYGVEDNLVSIFANDESIIESILK